MTNIILTSGHHTLTDAVIDTTDAVSTTTDAVIDFTDAVSDTTDAVSDTTDAVIDTTDAVSDTTDAVIATTDAVIDSTDDLSDALTQDISLLTGQSVPRTTIRVTTDIEIFSSNQPAATTSNPYLTSAGDYVRVTTDVIVRGDETTAFPTVSTGNSVLLSDGTTPGEGHVTNSVDVTTEQTVFHTTSTDADVTTSTQYTSAQTDGRTDFTTHSTTMESAMTSFHADPSTSSDLRSLEDAYTNTQVDAVTSYTAAFSSMQAGEVTSDTPIRGESVKRMMSAYHALPSVEKQTTFTRSTS